MFYYPRFSYINAEDPGAYTTPDIQPGHFWSRSRTDIATIRKNFFRQWLFASIELWIVIFLIATLYLGAGHNPNRYTKNLDVAVVDFDGDLAGRFLVNAFRQSPPGNGTLNWRFKGLGDYNNNVEEARTEVENGYVWATVILRTNTTRRINDTLAVFINTSALLTSPFVTTPPVLVSYEDGRNTFTVNNYVLSAVRTVLAMATAQYGQALRGGLIATLSSTPNSSSNRYIQLANTFQLASLLDNPLLAQYENLHPGLPYVGQLATTLGYIYLYLITGIFVGGSLKFLSVYVGRVYYVDLIVFRVVNAIIQGFIISLIYSLIVYWFFHIDSGAVFMRYWLFNWLAVLVFGLIIVLFSTNFGPIANSVLIVFVILMLAGATIQISLELSPRFYRYGYGLPLYHILNGGRHLLFGSHQRFGLTVGILLAYFAVFWMVAIFSAVFWLKHQEKKLIMEKKKGKVDKKKRYHPATIARR